MELVNDQPYQEIESQSPQKCSLDKDRHPVKKVHFALPEREYSPQQKPRSTNELELHPEMACHGYVKTTGSTTMELRTTGSATTGLRTTGSVTTGFRTMRSVTTGFRAMRSVTTGFRTMRSVTTDLERRDVYHIKTPYASVRPITTRGVYHSLE